jgi:hypothetical protein
VLRKHEDLFHSLHFTDQSAPIFANTPVRRARLPARPPVRPGLHIGSSQNVLRFKFYLPGPEDMGRLSKLLEMSLHFIDVIGEVVLRPEVRRGRLALPCAHPALTRFPIHLRAQHKQRALQRRAALAELEMRRRHELRQEEAARRREEKKRKDDEQVCARLAPLEAAAAAAGAGRALTTDLGAGSLHRGAAQARGARAQEEPQAARTAHQGAAARASPGLHVRVPRGSACAVQMVR